VIISKVAIIYCQSQLFPASAAIICTCVALVESGMHDQVGPSSPHYHLTHHESLAVKPQPLIDGYDNHPSIKQGMFALKVNLTLPVFIIYYKLQIITNIDYIAHQRVAKSYHLEDPETERNNTNIKTHHIRNHLLFREAIPKHTK